MPAYKNKGFFIGIAAFLIITLCGIFDLVPSSLTDLDGMKFDEGTKSVDSISAWFVLAVLVLMAIWWATEALPVAVTSLLPLALFPILDISNFQAAADPYANKNIYLFLVSLRVEKNLNIHLDIPRAYEKKDSSQQGRLHA